MSDRFHIIVVQKEDADIRLDRWMKRHYPAITHGMLEKALRKGDIKHEGKKTTAKQRLYDGEKIAISSFLLTQAQKPLPEKSHKPKLSPEKCIRLKEAILYKDEHIVVLNKPSGIAVQGGSSITFSIDDFLTYLEETEGTKAKLVHRIDKDTSGILLLARNAKAASMLTEAFRQKTIQKTYWAIVMGEPPYKEGSINLPLEKVADSRGVEKISVTESGKKALTHYKTIYSVPGTLSWLELIPVTGRTHQLRIHCLALGTPILGDGKYGGRNAFIEGLPKQLHLHARSIEIPNLFGKGPLSFTAPLPPHMQETWRVYGLDHFFD